MAQPSESSAARLALIVAAVLVVAGCVLRVYASLTDFWLDEIITLDWPRNHSYWALLFDPLTKHDNNHVLNSMWLKFVDEPVPPRHWIVYRLFALATGTVIAVAMGVIGWRRSRVEGLIAAGMGALSYVLIHYSSECRGYAPVCCFALLAWLALDRALRRPGIPIVLTFWVLVVLGVLSHSTFAFAFIGFLAWSAAAWWQGTSSQPDTPRAPGATLGALLWLHVVPIAILTAYYFGRIQGMTIGGGPEFGLPRVLTNTLAHVIGWAWGDWTGTVAAWFALAMIVTECWLRFRARAVDPDPTSPHRDRAPQSWAFFAAIVVITPLLVALVLQPRVLYMRYFLVCVPFAMLLIAGLLARSWRAGRIGRVGCVAMVVLMLGLNAWRMEGMLTAGRGQFLAALRYIVANDDGPEIRVTANEVFHVSRIIGFYNRYLERPVTFVELGQGVAEPRWVIQEVYRLREPLPEGQKVSIRSQSGTYYDLQRVFPFASMSGANWYVFARAR